jgi:hypothetical protein
MAKVLRAIGIVLALSLLGTSGICGMLGLTTGLHNLGAAESTLALMFGAFFMAVAAGAAWLSWRLIRSLRADKPPIDTADQTVPRE